MAKKAKKPEDYMRFVKRAQAHAKDLAGRMVEHHSDVLRSINKSELEDYVKCVEHGMLYNLKNFFERHGLQAMAKETKKCLIQMKWEDDDLTDREKAELILEKLHEAGEPTKHMGPLHTWNDADVALFVKTNEKYLEVT